MSNDFYCFVTSQWHVNVPTVRNKQKNVKNVLVAIRNSVYRSKDPDPDQNVTDPEPETLTYKLKNDMLHAPA